MATAPDSTSVACPEDGTERREAQEPDDQQKDEQSLLHVFDSPTQDAQSRYGFPYLRVRPAGESSTFPSAFSIRSTRTEIGSPRR